MTEKTITILKNEGLIEHVREWIADGWGLSGQPTNEQAAAALLMEARTQDECVRRGESSPEHPANLRRVAYGILDVVALDSIVETAKSLFDPVDRDVSDEDKTMREYERGTCEVVGRVMLDDFGRGEGTSENAVLVAKKIGIKDPYRPFKQAKR